MIEAQNYPFSDDKFETSKRLSPLQCVRHVPVVMMCRSGVGNMPQLGAFQPVATIEVFNFPLHSSIRGEDITT